MGRKVKVVTKCGDVHVYTHDQDVDTVEIIKTMQYHGIHHYKKIWRLMKEVCTGSPCDGCPLRFEEDPSSCIVNKYRGTQGFKELIG